MKKLLFALLTLSIAPAQADEVFKCLQRSGKTIYQSEPCERAEKQQAIEVPKTDPKKMAEEEAKLKAWEADFAKREAERTRIEKEQQDEQERKAALEALRQSAEYQKQQAYEAKRRTEELERQNREYIYPHPYYFPYQSYYPTYPYSHLYEHPHQHHGDSGRIFPRQPHTLPQAQPPAEKNMKDNIRTPEGLLVPQ